MMKENGFGTSFIMKMMVLVSSAINDEIPVFFDFVKS